MKKFLAFAFVFQLLAIVSFGQTKAIQTVKISTPSVQCDMCKKNIEQYLKRYDGIMLVNVNVKKKETLVKYYTDRTNEEVIKAAIANAGYDANEIAANPDAYKLLSPCCKKPDPAKKN